MNVHFTGDVEASVKAAVNGGLFSSAEEAMAEAWRASLRQQEHERSGRAMTLDDLHRQMLADGLLTRLPDAGQDLDDESEGPVEIDGEPLSETVLRGRRRVESPESVSGPDFANVLRVKLVRRSPS